MVYLWLIIGLRYINEVSPEIEIIDWDDWINPNYIILIL